MYGKENKKEKYNERKSEKNKFKVNKLFLRVISNLLYLF